VIRDKEGDGELLAQGEVLESELARPAEDGGEERKQVEKESNHRAGIVSGRDRGIKPLGHRPGFAKDSRRLARFTPSLP